MIKRKRKTKHKHRKIKVEIIKLGGHDDEDELIYNEDIIFNFMNKDNIKNRTKSKEKNISNKEYQINDDQSSLSNVSFSNKNIDTNNHSYHHHKQHNNNNDIIIKNLPLALNPSLNPPLIPPLPPLNPNPLPP